MSSRASDTAFEEKSIEATAVVTEPSKYVEWKDPPDGGWRAWLVVFGSFCGLAGTAGLNLVWTVFFNYYNTTVYPDSMTELSWIGSLAGCLGNAAGPLYPWASSKMDDRYIVAIGGLITVLSKMLASITNEIWQLWITQGILTGIGSSLVFYPCMNQTMTWFGSRRAWAVGICMSGVGFSSIAYSNIATACFQTVGYRWALRILGFIELVLCGIAALLCIKLNPQSKAAPFLDFSVFRNKKYVILVAVHFVGAFVLFIPGAFIGPYGQSIGIDPWSIANITGVLMAFNSVGSITLNFVADYLGRFNMAIISGLYCVIIQLSLWFTATTAANIWAFAILHGIGVGAFNSLIIAVIIDCVGIERSEVGSGWALFTWSFGALLGSPLASLIVNQTDVPNFQTPIIFSAVLFFFVTFLMLVLRIMIGGWSLFKKV